MEIRPLAEHLHTGYVLVGGEGLVVVNAPLDTDAVIAALAETPVAVVETGIPRHRIGGGRPLAAAVGARLYAPAGVEGAEPAISLTVGSVKVESVGGDDHIVAVAGTAIIGDLDAVPWVPDTAAAGRVAAARRRIAAAYPGVALLGSGGPLSAAELLAAPAPATGPAPLNSEAIYVTNTGEADMFWADPRYRDDAPATTLAEVVDRLHSPWGPVILDLGTGPAPVPEARRLEPCRVAPEMAGLSTERRVVVVADDDSTARSAAGFLAAVGINAAWANRESLP